MPKFGDVFRTEKEYTSTGKEAKPRWFIYLGQVSCFETPKNIYLCTTTTQLKSKRYQNLSPEYLVYFYKKNGIFESDCLIYLEDIITQFTQSDFDEYEPVYKGNIGNDKIIEIIKKLKLIDVANKIKKDIFAFCQREGISTK